MHVLDKADRIERAALYRNLGLELRYDKDTSTGRELVHARSKFFRSGGPILPLTTTGTAVVEVSAELVLE
jgi:hypothetical protein